MEIVTTKLSDSDIHAALLHMPSLSAFNAVVARTAVWAFVKLIRVSRKRLHTIRLRGPPNPGFLYGAGRILMYSDDPASLYGSWAREYGSSCMIQRLSRTASRPCRLLYPCLTMHQQFGRTMISANGEDRRRHVPTPQCHRPNTTNGTMTCARPHPPCDDKEWTGRNHIHDQDASRTRRPLTRRNHNEGTTTTTHRRWGRDHSHGHDATTMMKGPRPRRDRDAEGMTTTRTHRGRGRNHVHNHDATGSTRGPGRRCNDDDDEASNPGRDYNDQGTTKTRRARGCDHTHDQRDEGTTWVGI